MRRALVAASAVAVAVAVGLVVFGGEDRDGDLMVEKPGILLQVYVRYVSRGEAR